MEQRKREDELYLEYQNKMRTVEQNMEDWEQTWKKFRHRKEESQTGIREDQRMVEQLVASWGSSAESNEALCLLEDSIVEEQSELKKEKQTLTEEKKRITEEEGRYEEEYQNEKMNMQEEKTWE